jgi:hypothetical protein
MKIFKVVLHLTLDDKMTHPSEWDWATLLDEGDVKLVSVWDGLTPNPNCQVGAPEEGYLCNCCGGPMDEDDLCVGICPDCQDACEWEGNGEDDENGESHDDSGGKDQEEGEGEEGDEPSKEATN